MITEAVAATIGRTHPRHLDAVARDLWRAHANGLIDDDGAQQLAELIDARRRPAPVAARRVRQPRPASVQRRRHLAASGPLPPNLASHFTTGEMATLRIIGDEVADHGSCDRSIGEIAARAGVGRTTAQNAIRHAAQLGLIEVRQRRLTAWRNDTNVLRITSKEWTAWLAMGRRGRAQNFERHGQSYLLESATNAPVVTSRHSRYPIQRDRQSSG